MDFLQAFNNKDFEVESDGLILGSYVESIKEGHQGGPPPEEEETERKKKVRFVTNATVSVFEKYLPQPEAQKTSSVLQNLMKNNIAALTGRPFSSSFSSPSFTQPTFSLYGQQQQQRPGFSQQSFSQQQQMLQQQQMQYARAAMAQQQLQQQTEFKQSNFPGVDGPQHFTNAYPQLQPQPSQPQSQQPQLHLQTQQQLLQQPQHQPQQQQPPPPPPQVQPLQPAPASESATIDDFRQEIAALSQENDQLRMQLAQLPILQNTIETLKNSNAAMAKENAEILDLFEKGELSLEAEIAEKDEVIKNLRMECEELTRLEKEHHVEVEAQDLKMEQMAKQNQKLLTENQDLTAAIEEMELALLECRKQLQQVTGMARPPAQPLTYPPQAFPAQPIQMHMQPAPLQFRQ